MQFSFLYFGLVALEGTTFTRLFILSTAGVKFCMAAVKCHTDFISVLFAGTSGIMTPKYCIPLKPVLEMREQTQ